MQKDSNGYGCSDNSECASGQCYRGECFDAQLSCSDDSSCAASLTCSNGKCVCKC